MVRKITYFVLLILDTFLALSAFGGGIGLLTGFSAPPLEQLKGSIFRDYTIPGIALFGLVGGSALLAALLMLRKNRFATLASVVASLMIMSFEFVEVLAIGSPPGIAQALQIFYFGLGIFIAIASIAIWFMDISATPRPASM